MRKKIITLTLFVLSLFIFDNVKAADTYCGYRNSNETLYFAFNVDENGELASIDGNKSGLLIDTSKSVELSYNDRELIENWSKALKGTSLSGKDFFVNNNKKCPENVIISDNKENVAGKNVYVSVMDLNDMITKVKEKHKKQANGYPQVLSLNVEKVIKEDVSYCNYKSHTEDLTVNFEIFKGKIVDGPSVKGSIKGKDVVFNWYGVLEGTNFMGAEYFIAQDKCPSYFYIIQRGSGAYRFYVSNDGPGSDFEKKLQLEYPGMQSYHIVPISGSKEEKEDEKEWEDNLASSCMAFTNAIDCNNGYLDENNDKKPDSDLRFSCIWNENEFGKYCNTDKLLYVRCGNSFDIPYQAPKIISFIINFLKIVTPIILIIFSIISLIKAIGSANEDEIKKTQKSLVKKVVAAVMVFFVVSIVQFVIMKFADSGQTDDLSSCFSCFLNGDCGNTTYYKTNVVGTYFCTDSNGTQACK